MSDSPDTQPRKVTLEKAIKAVMRLMDYDPSAYALGTVLRLPAHYIEAELYDMALKGIVEKSPRRRLDANPTYYLVADGSKEKENASK